MATDVLRAVTSSWDEDVLPPDGAPVQEGLFPGWGGDTDTKWGGLIPLAQAKHVVKVFALPTTGGQHWLPVSVDFRGSAIRVRRPAEHGLAAATLDLDVVPGAEFPHVPKVIANQPGPSPTDAVAYSARALADFAKVRPAGPLRMHLRGADGITVVHIGSRFHGLVQAQRVDENGDVLFEPETPPAEDHVPEDDDPGAQVIAFSG